MKVSEAVVPAEIPLPTQNHDEELMLDAPVEDAEVMDNQDDQMVIDEDGAPRFPKAKTTVDQLRVETRKW